MSEPTPASGRLLRRRDGFGRTSAGRR